MRPARWLTPSLGLVSTAVLLLTACGGAEGTPDAEGPSPFADCATLTGPVSGSGASSAPASPPGAALSAAAGSSDSEGAGSGAPDLPDISLPCFTGGAPVRTTDLRGPAVINLWGSWCGPCREELPLMQELADATSGRLRVLGVDTRDSRDAGASFAADHDVTMPTLFDREQKLLVALGRTSLPVTVFLDAQGKRFVYTGKALDRLTLGTLVRTHTGVTVTG
ncbi:TlpA family protein disulfide reductase [Couchioplanes azureus]|uniref:TlpA family protein disulfide reductase n=1 Tax=Couchioplanes caeruleus TaxID=56438 RepID=UPI003570F864